MTGGACRKAGIGGAAEGMGVGVATGATATGAAGTVDIAGLDSAGVAERSFFSAISSRFPSRSKVTTR